jgi:hypothetical protein
MRRRGKALKALLLQFYQQALARAKATSENDYPNTIEGDLAARDAGALNDLGLEVFLDNENSWGTFRLIQRAAAAHGIDITDGEKGSVLCAAGGKLAYLLALLIRDHRKDLWKLPPIKKGQWTKYQLLKLAEDVDFIRERDGLPSDMEALKAIQTWPEYAGTSVKRLQRLLSDGRTPYGEPRRRGRPRKLAASGPKIVD